MNPSQPTAIVVLALLSTSCFEMSTSMSPILERRTERRFEVTAGAQVRVGITGGSIVVHTGPPGHVEAVLVEEVFASSQQEADRTLEHVESMVTQEGERVTVLGRKVTEPWNWGGRRVRFSTTLVVPADAQLDLDTSGGSITVQGDRTASVSADTSGGSIRVDRGDHLSLDTSGGSIRVGAATGTLTAETSGGSIRVGYVAPGAGPVSLSTSGGSIDVGLDANGRFALDAGTSGGSVRVTGLAFDATVHERSHASGSVNGGGHTVSLHTSGGSIRVGDAHDQTGD